MPFTINGIGTTYYGCRDRQDDGSFIATEWLVVLFLPILPLGSYRLWPGTGMNAVVYRQQHYDAEPVSLYWPQVIWGYLITAAFACVVLGMFIVMFLPNKPDWIIVLLLATFMAMVVVFSALR